MPSTHRIYLRSEQSGKIEQADTITPMFFDIDASDTLERFGSSWLQITRASSGRAWQVLFERIPDDARDGIIIDDLGARMRLIENKWYVDAAQINADKWYPLSRHRLTCLQWIAAVLLVGGLVVSFVWKQIPSIMIWGIIAVATFCIAADYLIQKRRI